MRPGHHRADLAPAGVAARCDDAAGRRARSGLKARLDEMTPLPQGRRAADPAGAGRLARAGHPSGRVTAPTRWHQAPPASRTVSWDCRCPRSDGTRCRRGGPRRRRRRSVGCPTAALPAATTRHPAHARSRAFSRMPECRAAKTSHHLGRCAQHVAGRRRARKARRRANCAARAARTRERRTPGRQGTIWRIRSAV